MKTIKMSLANMQGKMSREEMRSIMAGSGSAKKCTCNPGCTPGYSCRTDYNIGGCSCQKNLA